MLASMVDGDIAGFPDMHTAEMRAKYPEIYEHMLKEGRCSSFEFFWRDHYSGLKDAGYLLCPRYSPGWSAPWKNTTKFPLDFEDNVVPMSSLVMDAIWIFNGTCVMLKRYDRLPLTNYSPLTRRPLL
ncbi:Protein kinase domain-containing protein [Mycena venus]|uniref:Protein kinase domain-containing protein n=1 Tax=Mycena venus TaxID=2733690 RepID=A0A8H6YBA4_9AGAR|nr:Protein kinase domain-containing protein [Mycena venus]